MPMLRGKQGFSTIVILLEMISREGKNQKIKEIGIVVFKNKFCLLCFFHPYLFTQEICSQLLVLCKFGKLLCIHIRNQRL